MAVRDQALLGGRGLDVNAVRISWLYLRVGVMNELQYRVNFLVSLLQSAITLAVALAVLALIYSHTKELNGWTKPELLCVTGIQIFMGGVVKTYIQPNMNAHHGRGPRGDPRLCADEARGRTGARERARDSHLAGRRHRLGARRARVRPLRHRDGVGPADALAFAVALVFGAVLIYCFWLVIATGAFWVVNMWTAAELFDGVFATGRFPVGIYPGWLRYSVTFLVPVAFAVTVPAEAVTSRLAWETLLFAAVFAVVVFAATRWFWKFGLRRYSGASA